MKIIAWVLGIGAILQATVAPSWAAPRTAPVAIEGVWAGLSDISHKTAFVYLTMTLQGEKSDRLLSVETDVAGKAELLTPGIVKGRRELMPTAAVTLDSQAPTIFQPFDTHIILRDLTHALKVGDKFAITLVFEQAGKVEATVKVLKHPPATGMPKLPKGVKLE